MSTRMTPFIEKEFYHIYNRGNSKQTIFHDEKDKEHFLQLLCISNKKERFVLREVNEDVYTQIKDTPLVAIGAYTIMPNHFHLLITPLGENGVSLFMQKLSTAYVMYYNKKYKHTGSLFEGKFKSRHLDSDNYLKYIFSYIHLNIVKLIDPTWKTNGLKSIHKTLEYLRAYRYSSYVDFLDKGNKDGDRSDREEFVILDLKSYPKYFPGGKLFEKEIISWLSLKPFNVK